IDRVQAALAARILRAHRQAAKLLGLGSSPYSVGFRLIPSVLLERPPMSARKILAISSFAVLPVLYVVFYTLHHSTQGLVIERWFKWDRLLLLVAIIGLERLYTYRYAVSQRAMLGRDVIANIVNLYLTAAVAAAIVVPLLTFVPEHLWGRKLVFASSG